MIWSENCGAIFCVLRVKRLNKKAMKKTWKIQIYKYQAKTIRVHFNLHGKVSKTVLYLVNPNVNPITVLLQYITIFPNLTLVNRRIKVEPIPDCAKVFLILKNYVVFFGSLFAYLNIFANSCKCVGSVSKMQITAFVSWFEKYAIFGSNIW